MKRTINFWLVFLLISPMSLFSQNEKVNLMPYPTSVKLEGGEFRLNGSTKFSIVDSSGGRLLKYAAGIEKRLVDRLGFLYLSTDKFNPNIIEVKTQIAEELSLEMDEAYTVKIETNKIVVSARTDIGAMRGLETLLQLIHQDINGAYIPCGLIEDSPRFKWRGLMIDVCRHFMPVEVIKRNIDAMAAVKLNVFHFHLTEDQGFRVESKKYPKLHELGSDGKYFTQEQIKEIVAYAKARGIRVIPEFDIPGHATSWVIGHPELASMPGPYEIEQNYGIFDPTLDPTKEETYEFLDVFIGEMTTLFPDEYFHIGGDENNGKQWDNNKKIQKFMKKKKLKSNHELQAYFNTRVLAILQKYNKKMVGWDEIFQEDIPKEIAIQSWRGKESLYKVAKAGYPALLSNGYYLDLVHSAEDYYKNDPLPKNNGLTEDEARLILGGEGTMWSELVSEETIDSRIWPVSIAIAERLWSPQDSTQDIGNMYQRLEAVSYQLEEHGLEHLTFQPKLLRRLTGRSNIQTILPFVQILEPLKGYERHGYIKFKSYYPLTRLVDACYTESYTAKEIRNLIDTYDGDEVIKDKLIMRFYELEQASMEYLNLAENNYKLTEGVDLAKDLKSLSRIAQRFLLMSYLPEDIKQIVENTENRKMDCEISILKDFRRLFKM